MSHVSYSTYCTSLLILRRRTTTVLGKARTTPVSASSFSSSSSTSSSVTPPQLSLGGSHQLLSLPQTICAKRPTSRSPSVNRLGLALGRAGFHTTAATPSPSHKKTSHGNTKTRTKTHANANPKTFSSNAQNVTKTKKQPQPQPTSSRKLARPEAVSSPSSLFSNRTRTRNRTQRRERETETSSSPVLVAEPDTTFRSRSREGRRRRRRTSGGEVGSRSSFERDAAPHPVDHEPASGSSSRGTLKSDGEREYQRRREEGRAERDRQRERIRERAWAREGIHSSSQSIMHRSREKERRDDSTQEVEEKQEEFYQPKRLAESGGGAGGLPVPPLASGSADLKVSDESDIAIDDTSRETNKKKHTPLPTRFTSPPLLPGFVHALEDMFGSSSSSREGKMGDVNARPTVIQALSLKWIGEWLWGVIGGGGDKSSVNESVASTATTTNAPTPPAPPPGGWRQFLLAAETGSGKSIAYLLPLLQGLKMTEKAKQKTGTGPRGLVLAPTHELTRQLTGFAKELVHYPDVKLKVVCASRENVGGRQRGAIDHETDVLVGTPTKILERVRGRGWDRVGRDAGEDRHRDRVAQFGLGESEKKRTGDLPLADIEWVVIDEADVLFDPDFEATTRQLLADISAARGQRVPLPPFDEISSLSSTPLTYPFHLLLASATIPTSLNAYLNHVHPHLLRLASPGLHKLPSKLAVEYVSWTGGRKEKDVWKRVREVWRDDWVEAAGANAKPTKGKNNTQLSQIVIFCNKSSKAQELAAFLSEQISASSQLKDEVGVNGNGNQAVLVITGGKGSVGRAMGSNRHLESFLRVRASGKGKNKTRTRTDADALTPTDAEHKPLILITTSLLSRGLDFAPSVKHVFLLDAPRNKVDFLHRAGRAGRAGMSGRVVVFGRAGEALGKEVGSGKRR